MSDLFSNQMAAVSMSLDEFGGHHYDVWFDGKCIFTSPFKQTSMNFADEFNTLCQL